MILHVEIGYSLVDIGYSHAQNPSYASAYSFLASDLGLKFIPNSGEKGKPNEVPDSREGERQHSDPADG